jgi:UDP-galactopyranose mutase
VESLNYNYRSTNYNYRSINYNYRSTNYNYTEIEITRISEISELPAKRRSSKASLLRTSTSPLLLLNPNPKNRKFLIPQI